MASRRRLRESRRTVKSTATRRFIRTQSSSVPGLVAVADPGTPSDPLAELAFEIERFEWIGEDRLEVTGRWFGVRGLRFIRPTLHVRLGERRRRLIALLDEKPRPADADETWVAAFS